MMLPSTVKRGTGNLEVVMTKHDMILEALENLSSPREAYEHVTLSDAKEFVESKYGVDISDSTFYHLRRRKMEERDQEGVATLLVKISCDPLPVLRFLHRILVILRRIFLLLVHHLEVLLQISPPILLPS